MMSVRVPALPVLVEVPPALMLAAMIPVVPRVRSVRFMAVRVGMWVPVAVIIGVLPWTHAVPQALLPVQVGILVNVVLGVPPLPLPPVVVLLVIMCAAMTFAALPVRFVLVVLAVILPTFVDLFVVVLPVRFVKVVFVRVTVFLQAVSVSPILTTIVVPVFVCE